MPWLNARLAAARMNQWRKSVNPFMAAEKSEGIATNENQMLSAERKDSREDIHSASTIFGLDWARKTSDVKKLDQTLIENVRLHIEEERDRQIAFERMCRYNY
ncbi:hypothetical protein V3C99_019180 [Haemonchus contortus]|uniref:DUF3563 domain-containing protein n=1 Tax=Haemonchus contortus TaxID=6289 RepID=A0A7I4YZZ5_HAECO